MALRLLVCDLDGTLVDSFRDIATSCNLLLAGLGLRALPDIVISPCIGRGVRFLVEGVLREAEADAGALDRHIARYREIYHEHALDETRLYPGVRETLETLRGGNEHLRLAVLSNKPERATHDILSAFGIDGHFAFVAGGDSFEEMKPSPLPLRRMLQAMDVAAADAAIVGDSVYDLQAGKAAGMTTIAATYGFQTAEMLKALEPDFLVSAFREILQLLGEPGIIGPVTLG